MKIHSHLCGVAIFLNSLSEYGKKRVPMRSVLIRLFGMFVFLFPPAGCLQTRQHLPDVSNLDGWISIPPYKVWSPEWHCAAGSQSAWKVVGDKDEILVKKDIQNSESDVPFPFTIENSRDFLGNRRIFQVSDGWIAAYNKGEWGGSVWWFSEDGKKHSKISEMQITEFIKIHGQLYALSGLAHKTLSEGYLLKLEKNRNGIWTANIIAELKDAPYAYLKKTDASLLVVTSEMLLLVFITGRTEILHQGAWKCLYPNSVAVRGGVIYIGMRYAVARLIPAGAGYKEEWLVPPKYECTPSADK